MTATTSIINIAIIEDINLIRENLVFYFEGIPDINMIFDCGSIESYLHHLENRPSFRPDVLLLDIGLPGMSGLEAIPILLEKQKRMDILMLSAFNDQQTILKALCSGAVGYLSKEASQEEIVEGIRIVREGGSYMSPEIAREIVDHLMGKTKESKSGILTERQAEIIERLATGLTYSEIAEQLFLSVETIRTHIKKLYRVLQVNNKAEAIAMYLKGEIG